jgi:Cu(I)/Ag(I) efflux system membrane protein CusA/SilA
MELQYELRILERWLGPDIRRVADLSGKGDAVSGIIVMRQGQNALDVIERVKTRIRK